MDFWKREEQPSAGSLEHQSERLIAKELSLQKDVARPAFWSMHNARNPTLQSAVQHGMEF
jgi:hypothetical protein